jgi:PAS domain S-box-containing protein
MYRLKEHQQEILSHWWAVARDMNLVTESTLDRLSVASHSGFESFLGHMLDLLTEDGAIDAQTIVDQSRAFELNQREILGCLYALRQAALVYGSHTTEPEQIAEDEAALERRIDKVSLSLAQAAEHELATVRAQATHWQTLYTLNRELSASMDLGYVLKGGIARILGALDADRGAVLLLDAETGMVTPRAAKDWVDISLKCTELPSDWQHGRGAFHVLEAAEARESVFAPFVRDDTGMLIVAPLLANGQFYGILAIAAGETQVPAQHHDIIDAAVASLASSLGNAEVIQTLNNQARELGLMLRQHQEESSKREAILASIADGVVFNDRRGKVVLVNRAAEQILAVRAEELIERDLRDLFALFTTGAKEEILLAMRTVLSDPKTQISAEDTQTVLQIDNLIINAHFAPVITEQEEFLGIVTVLRDITKEAEADRAKSEFVSTVSHELRTPMTAIKGYTDLLYGGMVGEVNQEQKRFLNIVRSNADRLTALISDLLDISRIETGRVRFEPEPVQLGDVVKTVIDALTPNVEKKGHRLSYQIEAGMPDIMGDPSRLNQVFTNLVGNAINYTPEGGTVTVNVYSVQNAVRVDVVDSGIGIHSKDLSRIFERFYRAEHPLVQESRGSGLGLPIVKMFVEMHGGRVWAESEPEKGSTFTVLLPKPTSQHVDMPSLLAPERSVQIDKRHILIADDDRDIAELVRIQLEGAGYRVTTAGRGAQTFEIARRQCPDLILLDILLPDMDGRAILEMLKSDPATADIPVIMLTVVMDDGTASDLGAAGYLTKPAKGEELLAAVRLALSRRGRVLVVEDDPDTIEMMRVALRRVGYNVDVAAEGYEALTLARRWRPEAILLDLRLPGMDGYETLSHLKRSLSTQDIPIIVTSAHVADWETEEKRLKTLGVVGFLPKPFSVNQLVSAIDRATNTIRSAQVGSP